MSVQFNTDIFVTEVIQAMMSDLSDEQIRKLKNTLYIKLNDIEMTKKSYELALLPENNDTKLMEYFKVSKRLSNRSEKTINQYERSAWRLREFVKKNFCDITAMNIKYYMASMQNSGWSDVTTENQYNNLNSFFSFLCDEGFIDKNPMRKIERIKVHKKIKKPYSVSDLEKIRSACSDNLRDIALVEFSLATALRVDSIQRLKWSDIDFARKAVTARVKGGDIKQFRFNEKAKFYLLKYLDERMKKENRSFDDMMDRHIFVGQKRDKVTKDFEGITTDGIRYAMRKIGHDACVDKMHPHRFRRTFACNAISHGMPMENVKEHLGHKSIQTTFTYAEITDILQEQSYNTYCE